VFDGGANSIGSHSSVAELRLVRPTFRTVALG